MISFEDLHELNYDEQEDEEERLFNLNSIKEEKAMMEFYYERLENERN